MPLVSFFTPWKHEKNRGFWSFQEVLKETSGMKWVKELQNCFTCCYQLFFAEIFNKNKPGTTKTGISNYKILVTVISYSNI